MRRYSGKMNGERYLGNTNTKEVHDLDNEKTLCQINEILRANHEEPLNDLFTARLYGFDNCHWCIGGSKR